MALTDEQVRRFEQAEAEVAELRDLVREIKALLIEREEAATAS